VAESVVPEDRWGIRRSDGPTQDHRQDYLNGESYAWTPHSMYTWSLSGFITMSSA